jgi:hypothetical protein
MSSALSSVSELSQGTVLAAFQLHSFIQTGHHHASIIPKDLRAIIAHITSACPVPKNAELQVPTTRATRSGSATTSRESSVSAETSFPTVAWLANWAIDRTALRSDVKSFEQRIRPFTITPSTSRQGSSTTEEIPRSMAGSNSSSSAAAHDQQDNNYQDSGFSEKQYKAMQAMIGAALSRPPASGAPPGGLPGPNVQPEAQLGRP